MENCTFHHNVAIYSLHKQRNMFYITENVFNGGVEIFVKDISDDENINTYQDDSWIIFRENYFMKHPRILIDNMGAIFHRNTFNIREVSTVGTIIASDSVNITNNIFENHLDSRFGFRNYLRAEKKLNNIEVVFDIEDGGKVVSAEKILVMNYQNTRKEV